MSVKDHMPIYMEKDPNINDDVELDPNLSKLPYTKEKIGPPYFATDGLEYPTPEDVVVANNLQRKSQIPFIGKDGQPYWDKESLEAANDIWKDAHYVQVDKKQGR